MTFMEAFESIRTMYPDELGKFLAIHGISDPDTCATELLVGPTAMMKIMADDPDSEVNLDPDVMQAIRTAVTKVQGGECIDGVSSAALDMQLENALSFI